MEGTTKLISISKADLAAAFERWVNEWLVGTGEAGRTKLNREFEGLSTDEQVQHYTDELWTRLTDSQIVPPPAPRAA